MKLRLSRPLSAEAAYVLHHMRDGHRLVGSVFKRGTPFVLEFANGSEDVDFVIAAELIDNGEIVAVAPRGLDNAEYHPRGGCGESCVQDQ